MTERFDERELRPAIANGCGDPEFFESMGRLTVGRRAHVEFPDKGAPYFTDRREIENADLYIVLRRGQPAESDGLAAEDNNATMILNGVLLAGAARSAGAAKISLVMPYFPFHHESEVPHQNSDPKEPEDIVPARGIPPAEVARVFGAVGVNRILSIDFGTAPQVASFGQGEGTLGLQKALPLIRPLYSFVRKKGRANTVLLTSEENAPLIHRYDEALNVRAQVLSEPDGPVKVQSDLTDLHAMLLFSAATPIEELVKQARQAKEQGARSVVAASLTGLYTREELRKINNSAIDQLIVTNTVSQKNIRPSDKLDFECVDISGLFADAVNEMFIEGSVSEAIKRWNASEKKNS